MSRECPNFKITKNKREKKKKDHIPVSNLSSSCPPVRLSDIKGQASKNCRKEERGAINWLKVDLKSPARRASPC